MTSGPVYGRPAPPRARVAGRRENPLVQGARGRVAAVLRAYFNFLVLSLALVVVCLPLVTVPVACNAAMVALERWRGAGEDRVVREFVSALRSRPLLRTTLAAGAPLVVIGIGLEEVHYFARGGGLVNWICLGCGVSALLIAMVSMGYVLVFSARCPEAPLADLWAFSVRAGLRNLFVTGPLFVAEITVSALVGIADPALLLIGLPLLVLVVLRWTADLGVRRAGWARR